MANVLFDDWDEVWANATRACAAASPLCARLRRWLQPVWGLRLPPADYAHNDLNLSNVLTDGTRITGVVDWDEFGLGSRALDLVALAVDCEECGDSAAADGLLARAAQVAGDDGLRCLVSYRIIGGLAVFTHERQAYGNSLGDEECAAESAILDRLPAVAHEQRGAHLVLERADGRAQAGLDDVDPGRGPGEVQLLGNSDEVGQLPKLHQSMISMLISESNCWTDARISRTLKEHTRMR